jgi:hypothetical protein
MRYFKKGDIAIILICLCVSLTLLFSVSFSSGEKVCVFSNGNLFGEYELGTDKEIIVKYKDEFNKINIENRFVFVTDASCNDKFDVMQGKISKPGQSIICLPNRLIVTIKGETGFDALSY